MINISKRDNNLDNKKTYNKNTISINCIKKYINKIILKANLRKLCYIIQNIPIKI